MTEKSKRSLSDRAQEFVKSSPYRLGFKLKGDKNEVVPVTSGELRRSLLIPAVVAFAVPNVVLVAFGGSGWLCFVLFFELPLVGLAVMSRARLLVEKRSMAVCSLSAGHIVQPPLVGTGSDEDQALAALARRIAKKVAGSVDVDALKIAWAKAAEKTNGDTPVSFGHKVCDGVHGVFTVYPKTDDADA